MILTKQLFYALLNMFSFYFKGTTEHSMVVKSVLEDPSVMKLASKNFKELGNEELINAFGIRTTLNLDHQVSFH